MSDLKNKHLESKIQILLSEIILTDVSNPLANQAIIDEVVLSGDHSIAKVFVSFIDNEEESLRALNHSSNFIRSVLAKKLTTRITPQLKFIRDDLLEKINEVESLINKVNK